MTETPTGPAAYTGIELLDVSVRGRRGTFVLKHDGLVTGVAVGSATIVARVDDVAGEVTVTVDPAPLDALEIEPPEVSIIVGETIRLRAIGRTASGDSVPNLPVEWSSRDESIATIDETGLLTAIAAGATAVVATVRGLSATAGVFGRPCVPACP